MKNILHIIIAILILNSCKEDKEQVADINWKTELIGVGYIGEDPDSLNSLFSYYPNENNQPELLNRHFKLHSEIYGDTIILPNLLLYDLFRNMKMENRISDDSSSFLISKNGGLYKFSKITGHNFIPKVIYFKKYPNEYPKHFNYQFFSGFDRWDSFEIELNGKDSIRVWLKGSPYNPYIYEQNSKNEIDELFIGSYLNLVCENRYDTTTLTGVHINGVLVSETLVYNDSVFLYSTYFHRFPDGNVLLNYFRSKIDKKIHSLEEFDLEMKSPLKEKKFKELPVALENWEILAPPQEIKK